MAHVRPMLQRAPKCRSGPVGIPVRFNDPSSPVHLFVFRQRFACILGTWIALACLAPATAADDAPRFDILEFQVEGNEVLAVEQVERAVYPFLGEQKTVEDVEKARAALEQAYRDAGYLTVLVGVPEQEVKEKVVRLTVTAGTVSRVRVAGARYYSQGRILAQAPSLDQGKALYFPEVQKNIASLNQTEALRVVPVLRPGTKFGTTEVDLNVTDKRPYGFNVNLNNYASPNTTDLRLSAGVHYDNLWQRGHLISLTAQTSPQDTSEVRAVSGTYSAPLGGDRGLIAGYFVASNSSVAVVGSQSVIGKGSIAGLRWNKSLPAVGNFYHSFLAGADYKDFQQNVGQPGGALIEQPIRYVPATAGWSATYLGARGTTSINTSLVLGIRGLSDSDAVFANRRFNARGNFAIWKFDLSRTQKLTPGWALFAQLDGQRTSEPLIVNEQFLGGGASQTSVRGYLEAEVAGDDGTHATLELRRDVSAGNRLSFLTQLQVVAFTDGVYVTTHDPLPGTAHYAWISSGGLGLRASGAGGLKLRLDLGIPFRSTVYTEAGKPVLQFQASYLY